MLRFKFKMAYLLQILFILTSLSIYVTAERKQHICQFDELRKDQPNYHEIEEMEESKDVSQVQSSELSADTLSTEESFSQLRVIVSYLNLEEEAKHCKNENEKKKDAEDKEYDCTKGDIFTDEKKSIIKEAFNKAVQMHTSRLEVKKLKKGFKVPTFTGNGFCSRLTIPEEHKNTSISDADLVLYVSAASFKNRENYAYGFTCAIDKVTSRPLVGGMVIDVSKIDDSDYSTRVLAHEIGHILGFDLDTIEKNKPIVKKPQVRTKPNVNEFQGAKVIEKVKEHYECDSATGMEVEDQKEHSRTPWRGSLWESRNAKDELMAGVVRKGLYTYFTLAFFEDLGFYKANYTTAEHMEWGYKMGCEFLTKKCIENGKSNFPTMFCTEEKTEKLFCTADGRTMGTCVGLNTDHQGHIDGFYNYFPGTRKTGFAHLLTDNCPYIEEKNEADCQSTMESLKLPGKQGRNSLCIQNTNEKLKSAFGGHNGMCAEMTKDSDNGLSFTFDENWKPIICNTQESDSFTDENSFNNTKHFCSKPEEIIKKEEKKEESDSTPTLTTIKNDETPRQEAKKDASDETKSVTEETQSTQKERSAQENEKIVDPEEKLTIPKNGATPLDKEHPTKNVNSSEKLVNTSGSLINQIFNKTSGGIRSDTNGATHINIGITLLFFAALALY